MTTIVATRKGIYSDSRVSLEHLGIDYPTIKISRGKDCVVGAAGNGGDCSRFMEWAKEGFKGKEPVWYSKQTSADDYVAGLVVRDDGIYIWAPGDPLERIEADFFSIGSGGKPARVALLLGKTPEEAIELAILVDPGSGAPVQTLLLHP